MQTTGSLAEIRDGNVTVVVFGNEFKHLDETNVFEAGRKLVQLAENLSHPILVLDMSVTEFFGSSFIEAMFRVWKKLNEKPAAKFGIAGLQPYCREVLEVTHLDTIWPLFETREAACQAFNSP